MLITMIASIHTEATDWLLVAQDWICDLYLKLVFKLGSLGMIDLFRVYDHLLGRTSTWDDFYNSENLQLLRNYGSPITKVVTRSLYERDQFTTLNLIHALLRTKNPRRRISLERGDTVMTLILCLRYDLFANVVDRIDSIQHSPLWVMTQREMFSLNDIVDAIHHFRLYHSSKSREMIYLAIRIGGPRIATRSTAVASLDDTAATVERVNLELQTNHCWRKKLTIRIADITRLPLDLAHMIVDYLI